jgi:hypothetical protein
MCAYVRLGGQASSSHKYLFPPNGHQTAGNAPLFLGLAHEFGEKELLGVVLLHVLLHLQLLNYEPFALSLAGLPGFFHLCVALSDGVDVAGGAHVWAFLQALIP